MRYLKVYEDFNSNDELKDIFSLVISNVEVYEIPYSYYGSSKDFNIYVITGSRIESDDHKLVQELYHNHTILNKLYNLEFFYISLTNNSATIVLYEYLNKFDDKNYLRKIPSSLFKGKVKTKLEDGFSLGVLRKGIDWSNGDSSNLALFDWVYESVNNSGIKEDCEDILIDLSDDGVKCDVAYIHNGLTIEIGDNDKRIELKKYKDNFDRLFDYLESLGYRLHNSSYYEGDGWDYHERCPNCNSANIIGTESDTLTCNDCGHIDYFGEFSTPEHPLTKGDLMWSIKSGDKPDHMYLQFVK